MESSYKIFKRDVAGLLKRIESDTMERLVVFYGTSDYMFQKVHRMLGDKWNAVSNGVELTNMDGASLKGPEVHDLWTQSSMFQSRSLYVVQRSEKISNLTKVLEPLGLKGAHVSNFVFYLKRKSIEKKLKSQVDKLKGLTVNVEEPVGADLIDFIVRQAALNRIRLTHDCCQYLIESFNGDLPLIDNQLRMLSLIFANGEDREIGPADIEGHLEVVKEEDSFSLSKHLLNRDTAKANLLVEDLIRRGESSLAILALVARHARQSLKLINLQTRSSYEQAQSLRLPVHVVKRYNSYVRGVAPKKFVNALELCQDADVLFKSAKVSPAVVFKEIFENL